MKTRWLAAVAALSWAALTAAAQTPRAPTGEPIRLAMIEGLSGPFANTGEAVFRNLVWATERVNARGGVPWPGGARPLVIERMDSKGADESENDEAEDVGALRRVYGSASPTTPQLRIRRARARVVPRRLER